MAARGKSAMETPSLCPQEPQPQGYNTPWKASQQRFMQFQYEEAAGPREAFCRLWELCSQWLRPQTRSVEQILAVFVLEKFLKVLPADTETGRSMLSLETRERLFTLVENLPKDNGEPENKINIRDMLLEELVPMGTLLTRSDMHVRPPALQLMEPDQELHEMPPAEPQEMNIDEEEEEEKCGPFLDIEFHLAKEYEDLEPPGEEPPEQLLADTKEPEENQNQQEMPGTSNEVQEPLSSGAHTQAPPDEKPFSREQLGLCSAHRQQCNIHLEIQTGKVAQQGPRDGPGSSRGSDRYGPGSSRGSDRYGPGPSRGSDRYGPGPSRGSDRYGQQFISQKDVHVYALSRNSFPQAATVSEPEADYFDQERRQCRLCKREFMYTLGLIEHVRPQVVSRSHQCPFCGKTFRGQSHVIAHQVRHTDERPFPCNHCLKSYKHKSSLLRHLKFHTRENQAKASQGAQRAPHKASQ
ncbi:uncharacterized protein LOC143270829 [Peromyscus maniculatus bairdii]|uniref:uncharacterized protein LOC143270829 n=1 Tax=Peromyscus maniculatus bairdii TaxID=230844 RepID=UPI003FD56EAF